MMVRFLLFALLALPLCAQDFFPKQLTVGFGAAAPGGSSYMDPGVGLELNFGYRYTRFLQADIGIQTSFNKDYRDYYEKTGAGLRTATNFFLPAGARIIVPIMNGRIEPSFGLGGVYAFDKHADHQSQGGVYGLGGVSYALDGTHRHRVGVTLRYINMMSAGRPHPQWWNVMGEYTYSWGR
jgi:hypothetical protein